MTSRESVIARVSAARALKPIGRYIKFGSMGMEEVVCKCCEKPIRKLGPDDRFSEVRNVNGKNVVVERVTLHTLPSYCEIMLHFDDGSKHATFMCHDCSKTLTNEELEWLYCCDLNEWLMDNSSASEHFWAQQLRRIPTSFKAFPPGTIAE